MIRATFALSLFTLLVLGCRDGAPEPEPEPEVRTAAAPEASPRATDEADPDPAVSEAIRRQLERIRERQRCNRVMGCAPATALAQHREAAVGPILEILDDDRRIDGYWALRLVDLLGQLDDPRALPRLHDLLDDRRWEVRARTARALARLKRPNSEPPLRRALDSLDEGDDPAFRAAILHALERLDAEVDGRPARELLEEHLALDYEALAPLNPAMYAFLAEIVREARVSSALPLARLGAIHVDRFARLASIRTLGALRDTGGIPFLVGRLDDRLPSVRRAAIRALQDVTGSTNLDTAEAWRAWCERQDCRSDRREGLPPGTPESSGPGP